MSGTHVYIVFTTVIIVTLTFDPVNTKINRGLVLTKWNQHITCTYKSFVINSSQEKSGGNYIFNKSVPSDIDLWLKYLNVNRGYVFIKTNQHVKMQSLW